MKIKCLLVCALILGLFPVYTNALDKNFCDNAVYEEYYEKFNGRSITDDLVYAMGERNNRGKYINQMLAYCADPNLQRKCEYSKFGGERNRDRAMVNLPTFALLINNVPLFEALIHRGGYGYLIDNGVYKVEDDEFNEEFLTPALQAVREGQVGILEYLIRNYDPNLLKLSGYIHRDPKKAQRPVDAKTLAADSRKKFEKRGNYARVECMLAVERIVDNWYKENAYKEKYKNDAEIYNKIVLEWAPKYVADNDIPFEFAPSLDLFKLQNIEQNFTQNIDKKIDNLIEKIMRDFDLSTIGNPV